MIDCGTKVNGIIAENLEELKQTLRELDISGCPLYNETLILLGQLPLEELVMKNCIKSEGYFIGNLWSQCARFGNCEMAQIDMDLLWQDGVLKDTLKNLDISLNDLEQTNLTSISEIPLRKLNVSKTNIKLQWNTMFQGIQNSYLMENLKILRIRDVFIDKSAFSSLCNFPFHVLEITYDAVKEFQDFTLLLQKPIMKTLQELTLDLKNHCQSFISFIANFKLQCFECKLGTWHYYNFASFWNSPNLENLKILKLEDGKISENDANGISRLCLNTLWIYPFLFDSKEHILKVLSSNILQSSVIDLRMGGAYEIDNDHLGLILRFKKLEHLELKISGTNLTRIHFKRLEYLKSLKTLKLQVYIGLNIDEHAADALCSLSGKTELTLFLIGLGKSWPLVFTERAYHVFLLKNSFQNFQTPVVLKFSDCTLNQRCAEVFRSINIESICFSSCVLDNFLKTFFDGKMKYTLTELTFKRVDIDKKQLYELRNTHLTKLSIFLRLMILHTTVCLKF
ncbi:hypothetical protein HHI36_019239 [Cryptolaemus montrouzieri]|uniref:Uncharacterized protein n=1 Tax=Cryptolaemus montrouzieri TaxID=559131 RepID=A0ABD2P2E6_9CUCU